MRSSPIRFVAAVPRVAAIALLLAAGAMPQARAQSVYPAPTRALEDAIESHTEEVLLPISQPGTLTFRNCVEPCKLRTLELTAQSTLWVGIEPVTLADFLAHIRRSGPQSLTVFRQPGKTAITRLVVIGQFQ